MRIFKNLLFILALVVSLSFMGATCENTTAYYDIGSSSGIASVRVFYPVDTATHNAVTLSGGFTNSKETMYWLANYLANDGIIVFAVSASDNLSVSGYETAHKACYNLIVAADSNSSSPLYNRIDKIGLIGYSMGGGAVANVGNSLGSKVDAVVGLAPFGSSSSLTSMKASTLFMAGSLDIVAPAILYAEPSYNSLPSSIKKACVIVSGIEHLAWTSEESDAEEYIAAFLEYEFDGDTAAYNILVNPPSSLSYYGKNL